MLRMFRELCLDLSMFSVVSCDVVAGVKNRFELVRAVVITIPCLMACVCAVFDIGASEMFICFFFIIGGLKIGVITSELITSAGLLRYLHCYVFSTSVSSIHTVVN